MHIEADFSGQHRRFERQLVYFPVLIQKKLDTEKYHDIIEMVAERALLYGNVRYKAIKAMLEKGMTDRPSILTAPPLSEMGRRFLRSPDSFKGVTP